MFSGHAARLACGRSYQSPIENRDRRFHRNTSTHHHPTWAPRSFPVQQGCHPVGR
jgi:hypothetical protein